MSSDDKPTGDSAQREREKREAREQRTEEHAPADRDDKSDRGEEAVREGVPSEIASRSD
jgi:hypothetical protein